MTLIKTLPFQLDVSNDNEQLLHDATLKAREAYNQAILLEKQGTDTREIADMVAVDLVQNTKQRIVAKALTAMESYHEYDDVGLPSHTKNGPYPLRMNFREGYDLTYSENETVSFRISVKPYEHVIGTVRGDPAHLDIVRTALEGDDWKIGTAEVLWVDENPELHVSVTYRNATVRDKQNSRTVIGIDVNEDNVALTAMAEDGLVDTLVIDFPELKFERHRQFTIRKRIQTAGKMSLFKALESNEKRFVRDRLHKVSRHIVEFVRCFEKPCIVFEDLKGMRDGFNYGPRMNRRLHHLPFRTLQRFTSYKAGFEGIPTARIDPYKTSQRCALTACEHAERSNRRGNRFACRECGHQDHADRNASINIANKGLVKLGKDVPALERLPCVRKVRRQASGLVGGPTPSLMTVRDDYPMASRS